MALRPPINPNLFRMDDGRMFDTTGQNPLALRMAGQQQIDQRRQAEYGRDSMSQMQGNPLAGLWRASAPLPSGDWDGYFGLMQGKENAIASQGGDFRFDPRHQWGNLKQEATYNPMWDAEQGEQSAVGEAYKDSRGNVNYRRRGPMNGLMQARGR